MTTIFRSSSLIGLAGVLATLSMAMVPASAGEADVVDAKIVPSSDGSYRFDVALLHADTGWEHYADAFEILDGEGNILATRILVHPHVDEQPFTRSLSGVKIGPQLSEVTIRGRDSVHEYGGIEMVVQVPR